MHGARYYVTLLDDRIVTLLDGYYVTLLDIGLARYWPAEISHAIGHLITYFVCTTILTEFPLLLFTSTGFDH